MFYVAFFFLSGKQSNKLRQSQGNFVYKFYKGATADEKTSWVFWFKKTINHTNGAIVIHIVYKSIITSLLHFLGEDLIGLNLTESKVNLDYYDMSSPVILL